MPVPREQVGGGVAENVPGQHAREGVVVAEGLPPAIEVGRKEAVLRG